MKRIFFALLPVLLALASCAGTKQNAGKVSGKEIGLQLYSIRSVIGSPDLYAKNHAEVLRTLAEMGYTSVEAAYYGDGKLYGIKPEQYKADMEAAGLKSLSSHIGKALSQEELQTGSFEESMKWWDQAIDCHKRAGCRYIVCPGFPVPNTLAGLKTYCDYFNAVGRKCKESGILFGYHNHSHEFNKVEDNVVFDYMLKNTDPEYVFFEMDVYWAVMGRSYPVEYFKKYPGRFRLLHIKDHLELGESGMVGFDAIFRNADVAGLENYIVEIEAFSRGDWKESLKMCADYLLRSDFVKKTYPVQ